MFTQGRFVIAAILGLALLASAWAWWYRTRLGDQALHFWGSEAAVSIRRAPRVALLRLRKVESPVHRGEILEVDGRLYSIADRRDITGAPGLLNARNALVEDSSFEWSQAVQEEEPVWAFALQFSDGSRPTIVLVDEAYRRVRLHGRQGVRSVSPIAEGLRTFVGENSS